MTDMSKFAQGWTRQKVIQEAVRAKAEEEGLLRQPTPEEVDRRLAENVVYRRQAEAALSRIQEVLKETGLKITFDPRDERILLTDDESDDYLDVHDGTWH